MVNGDFPFQCLKRKTIKTAAFKTDAFEINPEQLQKRMLVVLSVEELFLVLIVLLKNSRQFI